MVKSLNADADLLCEHELNGIVPKSLSNVKMLGSKVGQHCFNVSPIV